MADVRPTAKLITPPGTAIYPKLNKPDTKFDAAGVYDVKLRMSPDAEGGMLGNKTADLPTILEKLESIRDEFLETTRAKLAESKNPKSKKKAKEIEVRAIGEADLDEDGDETGDWILKARMKASGQSKDGSTWSRAPKLFDAKNKPLDIKTTQIWGGSVLKVACKAVPYYAANDNVVGVSLYLEAVQVIDLVSGGGREASDFGFGEEDGYVAPEKTDDAPFGAADEDDDSDDNLPEDF